MHFFYTSAGIVNVEAIESITKAPSGSTITLRSGKTLEVNRSPDALLEELKGPEDKVTRLSQH